jgi:hypothetical protein
MRRAERHRMATVVSLTGRRRVQIVLPLLVVLTFVQAVGEIARGRWQRALAGLSGLFGLLTTIGGITRRRSRVRLLRRVPDHEVVELQVRGSVRWKRMIRHRRFTPSTNLLAGGDSARERSPWALTCWAILGILLFLGGRQLWTNGVHSVGDLLPLPESPRDLLRQYVPKKRPMKNIYDEEIKLIENRLNNRPCKRLGFRTPAEVFHQSLSRVALRA